MRTTWQCLLLLVWGLVSLCADESQATFKQIKGKVEYQVPGQDWQAASPGLAIPAGTRVSTGFRSSASLELLGSLLYLKPLTRLTVEELQKTAGGTATRLTLIAGRVRAEVKPSTATSLTDFSVKSPTATASVRGTGFEFDGVNLLVNHGNVDLANQFRVVRAVQGGEFSSTGQGTVPSSPVAVKAPETPAPLADNQDVVAEPEGGFDDINQAVTLESVIQVASDLGSFLGASSIASALPETVQNGIRQVTDNAAVDLAVVVQ